MRRQQGFTIIELVIVIAILGILGAVALPKFADLTGDARAAAFDGIKSGFTSAVLIAHSKWLAAGSSATTTTYQLEGGTIQLNSSGWPTVAGPQDDGDKLWANLMSGQIPADWTGAVANTTDMEFTMTSASRTFTYDSLTGAVTGTY